ncbi:MAG: hypothetical protein M1837_000816 [Sclerophora amabilis]|nr:MAG: hypothetical protein M1837_000816 [Sclerophora amabilis]
MRSSALIFGLLPHLASANIVFNHVELSCDASSPNYTGCLRGQRCLSNGSCKATYEDTYIPSSLSDSLNLPSKRDVRSDGRCGTEFENAYCDADGDFGGCCSQYGYCGKTPEHCQPSKGCQGGCNGAESSAAASSSGPTLEKKASEEPVLGNPTSGGAAATGAVTTDGSCGRANDGTVCGDFSLGSCCSVYGFCGDTLSHCGDGCQSGPCIGGVQPQAPGPKAAPPNGNPGSFRIVGQSGVPAMHAGLLPNGRVVFLDKVENYSQLKLSNGQYAYSSEYDPATKKVVPLAYKTNAFCAGGTFLADGRFVSFGGNAPLDFIDPTVGDGFDGIRYLSRSSSDNTLNGKDWSEPGNKLNSPRWYASAQTLGDGTVFVVSGSKNGLDPTVEANNNPTYELLSPAAISNGADITMDILIKNQPYYMYPFVHLLRDGSLFFFVAKSADLFNVQTNTVVHSFPDLPGDYRTYPNTGTSVLLPLSSGNNWEPDVVICGGGAYQDVTSPTDASCGRIKPLSENAQWELDAMPEGRGMVDGTLLPDGTVIFLNGCNRGAQGFGLGRDPTFEALIYDPTRPLGQRFSTGASSTVPRLYHSVALLLLDGTLLVTGSNPVEQPKLEADEIDPYVTDFRVEIYVSIPD